jgi:hypothetical protein
LHARGRGGGCDRPDANVLCSRGDKKRVGRTFRRPHEVRHYRASGAASLRSQTCLTCRGRARGRYPRHSGRSAQRPPDCSLCLTSLACLHEAIPGHAICCTWFRFRGNERNRRRWVVWRAPQGFDPSTFGSRYGRRAQVLSIHLTVTHGQNRRRPPPPAPAEAGSCGASARHFDLFGADARAPPRPTSTGVRRGRTFSQTQPIR